AEWWWEPTVEAAERWAPSTMLRMVPLPVPGRISILRSSMPRRLPIRRIGGKVGGDRLLPLVAVGEQFGLVVEQFLARFGREFEVRSLDDRIHRACLLAQPAIDAFDHVDVVAGGAAAAVLARLGLDRNRQRRTHGLAQFARDAALFAVGIAAQRMLAAEARALRRLFVRVIDRRLGLEEILQGQRVR